MKTTKTLALFIAAAAMLMAGCASKVPLAEDKGVPIENRTGTTPGAGAGGAGAGQSGVTTVNAGSTAATSAPRIVYFDFDSYTIKDEYRGLIESSARAAAGARSKRMTVEGHTDERGGARIQPGARPEARGDRGACDGAARCQCRPDRGRELRQGAAGGAGQR